MGQSQGSRDRAPPFCSHTSTRGLWVLEQWLAQFVVDWQLQEHPHTEMWVTCRCIHCTWVDRNRFAFFNVLKIIKFQMASLTSKFSVDICSLLFRYNVTRVDPGVDHQLVEPNVLKILVDISSWKTIFPLVNALVFVFVSPSVTQDMMLSLLPLSVYRVSPFFYEPVFIQKQETCALSNALKTKLFAPFSLDLSAVTRPIRYYLIKNEPYDNKVVQSLTLRTYMASQPSVPLLYVYVLQVAMACQTLMWSKIKHGRLNCDAVDLIQLESPYTTKVTCGSTKVIFKYDETLKYSVYISKLEHSNKVEDVDASDFITFFKDFYLTLRQLYHTSYGQKMNLISLVTKPEHAKQVLRNWDPTDEKISQDSNVLSLRRRVTPPSPLFTKEKTAELISSYASFPASVPSGVTAGTPAGAGAAFTMGVGHGFPPGQFLIPVLPRLTKTEFKEVDDDLEMFLPMEQILENLTYVLSQSRLLLKKNIVLGETLKGVPLSYVAKPNLFHPSGEVNTENVFKTLRYL